MVVVVIVVVVMVVVVVVEEVVLKVVKTNCSLQPEAQKKNECFLL